jgi:protein-S-isoprenylcysteine O-methyltransferase Ste14
MILALKNLLFTLVVPGTVGVYVPLLLVQGRSPSSGLVFFLALTLFAIGGVIYAWCMWDFAFFGRGTPAPMDEPKKLMIRGLYQYSRNPMYLGVLTTLVGWAVMFRGTNLLIYALCVWMCFYFFVVLYEEPHLKRRFGAEYHDYCKKVGRWLPHFRGLRVV